MFDCRRCGRNSYKLPVLSERLLSPCPVAEILLDCCNICPISELWTQQRIVCPVAGRLARAVQSLSLDRNTHVAVIDPHERPRQVSRHRDPTASHWLTTVSQWQVLDDGT